MDPNRALIEALRADRDVAARAPYSWLSRRHLPEDLRLKLVWADVLMERGDRRGEQLVLEHAVEHEARETWADDARRLLQLVCERGFVCVPDDPDASLLAWSNDTGRIVDVHTFHAEHAGEKYTVQYLRRALTVTRGTRRIAHEPLHVDWSDADVNLYLHAVSDAVRAARDLVLPARDDPRHRPGPYPRYRVPFGGTVAARDISRWNAIYRRLA